MYHTKFVYFGCPSILFDDFAYKDVVYFLRQLGPYELNVRKILLKKNKRILLEKSKLFNIHSILNFNLKLSLFHYTYNLNIASQSFYMDVIILVKLIYALNDNSTFINNKKNILE